MWVLQYKEGYSRKGVSGLRERAERGILDVLEV